MRKLGRGKYSSVYEGYDIGSKQTVAIKILRAIAQTKIKREIFINSLLVHDNIARFVRAVRCSEAKTACLVLEYVPHQDFRQVYPSLNLSDIRHYAQLLFAVPLPSLRVSTSSTRRASCTETSSRTMCSSTIPDAL